MSINKFWAPRPAGSKPNYVPFHKVTHRPIGDIPGCLEAKDVFVSIPLEEMRVSTGKRADEFCALMTMWIKGEIDYMEFSAHPFHQGDADLSVIRNPSTPSKILP